MRTIVICLLLAVAVLACNQAPGENGAADGARSGVLQYIGPAVNEAPETEWKTRPNAGQNILSKSLTQAFYLYEKEPYGRPVDKAYGNYVDPIGYDKFHYEGDTVRVGLIGCLSGPVSDYSGNMLKGAQLAMDEFNADGGYFGMPFEIITRDDQAKMGISGHKMVELIFDEEVLGILGSMSSDTTHVGIRIALKAEVPQMTSISTDPTITQIIIPWAFRILADDWSQGRAMAKLVFEDFGFTKIAILERNNRYGRMGSQEIARVAQRLGHPVEVKLKYESQKDFSAQLRIVKEYQPEAVVIWGMYANASMIVKQAHDMGIHAQFFGADGLVSEKFIELAGENAEGVIVTFPFNDTRETPETRNFIENYTRKYGRVPDSFSAHGYDAMLTMGQAILSAGEKFGKKKGLNRTRIRDELSRTKNLPGATGLINFDHTGNDSRVVEFAIIQNGKFEYLNQKRLEEAKKELGQVTKPNP